MALAVIGVTAYAVLGDGADDRAGRVDRVSNSGVAVHSKGYELVAPASVGAFTKSSPGSAPAELNAEQQKGAERIGVRNARAVSGIYNGPGPEAGDPGKVGGRRLSFDGLYGDIADPAAALDRYLAQVGEKGFKGDGKKRGLVMEPAGSATAVEPAGFEGALMKCQDMKVIHHTSAGSPKESAADFRVPVCAWADYSTLGGANVFELAQAVTGGEGASREEAAAVTAELFRTARRKS
ncbi:hypothetical protein C0216_20055 [Streptomyces globosus]|uniref:Uncharacterized protein n=1 Tax=Streptomyces globosus TaxID=68209 RepID=A0A344U3G3_9ACTN|nr:hypothetical protein C0216_20055 [Streptomyces globosus]